MNKEKEYLTCTNVTFYGVTDEEMFFEWVKMIAAIESFEKSGSELYLILKNNQLSEDDLYEILYLFQRYKIDMKQLRRFLTEENKKLFFKAKKAYWYKPLFGDA